MKDQAECVQLEFDTNVTSFDEILEAFWEQYTFGSVLGGQYRQILFYEDDQQRAIAEHQLSDIEKKRGVKYNVRIQPVGSFYLAEGYHQKYNLRHEDGLMDAFSQYGFLEFTNSHAASRLNAYVAGFLSGDSIMHELDTYDMSEDQKAIIRRNVSL